nr:bifunctional folylpolyglutamate synthase/dihydrofolate synthase [Anaerolineae bacterium]
GSTAAFIAQVLTKAGYKTGLYISPHLQEWHERIQINRQNIAGEALDELVEAARPLLEGMPLSTFEVSTGLALWHFAREGCDVGIIEVGLGGRLDATSVVEPAVSVITGINYDHTQLLGNTLAEIAGEKAAIIKANTPVVSAPQPDEALHVIRRMADERNSPLLLVGSDWQYEIRAADWEGTQALIGPQSERVAYTIGLPGDFQVVNATTALAVLSLLDQAGIVASPEDKHQGLESIQWPGRLEVIQNAPRIVLDSAHNPASVQLVANTLSALGTTAEPGKRILIFGCMADKDSKGMLEAILPLMDACIFTHAESPRAASPSDLLDQAGRVKMTLGLPEMLELTLSDSISQAVTNAMNRLETPDTLLITGSLAIAGAARSLLVSP